MSEENVGGGGGFGHQRWQRGNLPEQQDRASQAHRLEDDSRQ
jgi:hypothetical protein